MKTKINTAVTEVNEVTVKLQSKPDNEAVNGWAVIAYLPDFSIRSKSLHSKDKLGRFLSAVGIAAGYQLHELRPDIEDPYMTRAEEEMDELERTCEKLMPTI